ncbi:acetylglutamate kinase [Shouchella shacheensis]|uniref:acetylglutamate kinase n=1 Tax=Shouchella shacheensis TaxID=1649580 RepID=UPI00073FAC78|nr:acetylglutamate kinase [Shouchella shacheensis]
MSQTIVVKVGGSTLASLSRSFFASLARCKQDGDRIVLVHGGGPDIDAVLASLQIKSEFVNGLRKTTKPVLETVEMVLCGRVNKELVTQLYEAGAEAIGLSGCDGHLLTAEPQSLEELGFVGDVKRVNTSLLQSLLAQGVIPVIAPVGMDEAFVHYNINADTAAAAIASQLGADELVFVTDVNGIQRDGEYLPLATTASIEAMIADGTIYGGMIPKVQGAMRCLTEQLKQVRIVSGAESFEAEAGTKIVATEQVINQ